MTTTLDQVTERLWRRMPLAGAMGVEVLEYDAAIVRLSASLAKNLNYHQTGFGGSIATLGILAGWMMMNLQLNGDLEDCSAAPFQIVIQESRTEYLRPIIQDFEAVCRLPDEDTWRRFHAMLSRKGVGRVTLVSEVHCGETLAARETGIYVASPAVGR